MSRRMRMIGMLIALVMTGSQFAGMAAEAAANDWNQRLELLRPQEPERYFELAEEVADAASSPTERELAQHLFALAGALEPERLGHSACLALADMEENAQARRRLQALAALLPGPSGVSAGDGVAATPDWTPAAATAVAEALGRYRRGDGTQALAALREPGADALLQHFGRLLPGGYQRFIEDCKVYRGQQAPTLSSTDVLRMLRFEEALLAGRDRTWSSELLLSAGQPLIEVDPMRLEESLNVDITRPIYRNGRWVER
jgi:hypothetical protein